MRRLLFSAIAMASACSPGPRTHDDPGPDAAVDAPPPPLCYEPSVSGKVVPGVSNIQSCAIWNSLAQMTGDVTLTRAQTMPEELTMAFATGVVYAGTVNNRAVALTYTHLHNFTDGCVWRATETLTGDLDPTSCVMALDYKYVETVETSNGACASPCAATGSFSLQIMPIIE